MKILFSHQNFPAQFGGFGAYLARTGCDVSFMTAAANSAPPVDCRMFKMTPHREPTKGVHRFAVGLEKAMINAQAFANAAIIAREKGFVPDVVVAHSGWGSGTFAKSVWPDCKYVSYVEWYYCYPPIDSVLDNPKQNDEDGRAQALARNAPTLLDLSEADLVLCPTHFQASQFPERFRREIHVMHDGVDTQLHAPAEKPNLPGRLPKLPDDAEIVTYATRGMEPHRGFPEFMRALEVLQKERPNLYAIIGGEDRVAYGPKLPKGESWKQIMLKELDLDQSRLVWTGLLPRAEYVQVLQSSHAHVYLTVPFVLSWSLIEAMSIGCPLVVSNTEPLREVCTSNVNCEMVEHRDVAQLAAAISRLLDDRKHAARLGRAARSKAINDYDARWIWPARRKLLMDLAAGN